MQVLEKIKIVPKLQKTEPSIQVIIFDNGKDYEILGRKLIDWVMLACGKFSTKVVPFPKGNLIECARECVDKNADFVILFTNTIPLIQPQTVSSIVEYCTVKNCNLTKLPVGYVAKVEYLESNDTPQVDSLYSQNLDDFYVVENKKQCHYALEILQERINNFHIANGVDIVKPKSVYIEPDVDISAGVTIYQNNTLKGKTKIQKDVILKENNVIDSSVIGPCSCVSGSTIVGSVLGENVYVSSYCHLNNALVGRFSTIGSNCHINGYNVTENSKVKSGTVLGENDESSSGTGKSR